MRPSSSILFPSPKRTNEDEAKHKPHSSVKARQGVHPSYARCPCIFQPFFPITDRTSLSTPPVLSINILQGPYPLATLAGTQLSKKKRKCLGDTEGMIVMLYGDLIFRNILAYQWEAIRRLLKHTKYLRWLEIDMPAYSCSSPATSFVTVCNSVHAVQYGTNVQYVPDFQTFFQIVALASKATIRT